MKRPVKKAAKKSAAPVIDPYLPDNGNFGYRVSRYELDLEYKVAINRLTGTATITAATLASLKTFTLDLADALSVTKVMVNGNSVKLTSLEFRLLSYLMHHKGKVVSRTELVEHLYDQDFDRDSNTIEVFVGRLRKKLGVDVLHTIRGMGYCVSEPDNAAG